LHSKSEHMPEIRLEEHGTISTAHGQGLERQMMARPLAQALLALNPKGAFKPIKGNPICTGAVHHPQSMTARFISRELAMAAGATSKNAATASDLRQLLLSRRTVNSFDSKLPTGWEGAVKSAVHAATYAPNHKMTEPWRFHLLGPQAIRRVCELNAEIVSSTKGPEAGAKKLKRWLAMPGWLVVTCVRSNSDGAGSMENPNGIAREDYAACCCAVQNLCLSLHADGIGTKWTTGAVNFDPRFGEAVGLPSNEYVIGTIWFGQAEKQPRAPLKKLSVDDVLCRHD